MNTTTQLNKLISDSTYRINRWNEESTNPKYASHRPRLLDQIASEKIKLQEYTKELASLKSQEPEPLIAKKVVRIEPKTETEQLITELLEAIERQPSLAKEWETVLQQLLDGPKEFKKIEVVEHVKFVVNNILKINNTSLMKDQIVKICEYSEKFFQNMILKGKFYLRREETGLAGNLEYDPHTKFHFIHTNDFVGKGAFKRVTKSILFGKNPEVLCANAQYSLTNRAEQNSQIYSKFGIKEDNEIKYMQELKGIKRVIQLIAAPTHKEGPEIIQEIITELCPLGVLYYFDLSNLTLKDKVCMARDLMEGLMGAHARKITHNDLHRKNVFVERNKDAALKGVNYRLIIADWGLARKNQNYYRDDVESAGVLIRSLNEENFDAQFELTARDVIQFKNRTAAHWYKEFDTFLSKI